MDQLLGHSVVLIMAMMLSISVASTTLAEADAPVSTLTTTTSRTTNPTLAQRRSTTHSCYKGVEFGVTVTSIVLIVLGLQLTSWTGWILVRRHRDKR
ncbi:hypothetical protein PV08_01083 [Exophiala spinifera]|uniref:Uncharacterized protein n=1 Tax=Exophiala spinifera TaxID=91928 RepID=A0A0D2BNQ5_9EURO|nr:uncharacterized protein PV08_01083 [Exophiala spinifera]KIW20508.1 hypothetical protein PV08_01083 [Exophiala spinifera]